MIANKTERIYTVEADRWINCTDDRQYEIFEEDATKALHNPSQSVRALNVRNADLISLQKYMDDTGREVTIPYMVAFATAGAGLLIPCEAIEQKPQTWTTDRLRFLVQSLEYGEFEQFNLPLTAAYIQQSKR